MNASTTLEQNLVLEERSSQVVDETNASIVQMSFNSQYIAVRMNVSALDRLVCTIVQPVNNGSDLTPFPCWKHLAWVWLCVWEAKDHYKFDDGGAEQYGDWEIHQLHLATNYSEQLTSDRIDQINPIALQNGLVYIEVEEDGTTTFNVLNRGAELATYSSLVLQWSVLLLIALTFIYIMQRQKKSDRTRLSMIAYSSPNKVKSFENIFHRNRSPPGVVAATPNSSRIEHTLPRSPP